MQTNSGIYKLLWIIVPFRGGNLSSLFGFLSRHIWFIQNGGRILLKSDSRLNSDVRHSLRHGCLTLLEAPDSNIYEAWNQAIEHLGRQEISDKSYIIWLGLDDSLQQDFLSRAVQEIPENSYPDFIFGDVYGVFAKRYRLLKAPNSPELFGAGPFSFDVFHPGLLNLWGSLKNRRFDTRYKLAADLDFYIGINHDKSVTYRKIDCIQAMVGSDGISQEARGKLIYSHEWLQIEKNRGVSLRVDRKRIFIFEMIARFPAIYRVLRIVYWRIVGLEVRGLGS